MGLSVPEINFSTTNTYEDWKQPKNGHLITHAEPTKYQYCHVALAA